MGETVPPTSLATPVSLQELMVKFPLKEIQSTRTQRPTASSSYPYVEIALGDVAAQRTMQLQLEQVGPAPRTQTCHPDPPLFIPPTRLSAGPASKVGQVLAVPQGAYRPVLGTELMQLAPLSMEL